MNEKDERVVNVIKFEIEEARGIGDFVETGHEWHFVERLPIFTIVENETVPPLESAMTDRAKQLLIDQGFIRNKDAEYGQNNRDEVWTKKTNYAASAETVKIAKIVLHDVLADNYRVIAKLNHGVKACQALIDDKQTTINSLQSKIKTATLWQRVNFLFGGDL